MLSFKIQLRVTERVRNDDRKQMCRERGALYDPSFHWDSVPPVLKKSLRNDRTNMNLGCYMQTYKPSRFSSLVN